MLRRVLIGAVALLALTVVLTFGVGHEPKVGFTDNDPNMPERATSFPLNVKGLAVPTSKNIVYRVVGTPGTTAEISFQDPYGSEHIVDAKLPWSIALTPTAADPPIGSPHTIYVEANTNSHGLDAQVTCQVIVLGKRDDQETVKAVDAVVMCGTAP
jgi:hypothetical protein